jgi:chromosome segregation ATPase
MCTTVTRLIRCLISQCRSPDSDPGNSEEEEEEEQTLQERQSPDRLAVAMQTVQHHVQILADRLTETMKRRQQLTTDYQIARQTISELETRIRVIETEKTATDECNARYDKERQELGEAIATLRSALEGMKKSLVSAEEDKKTLKTENARLRLELEKLKA